MDDTRPGAGNLHWRSMFEEIGEFDRPGGDGGNRPRGGKAEVKLLMRDATVGR